MLSLLLNPIILAFVSAGSGVNLKTFSETKNYIHKIEMCMFAYETYQLNIKHC